jgi:hypothetical protein
MSDRDGLDLLDLRLTGHLHERAEMAAAYGPGVEALAASIADAGPGSARSRGVVGGLPTLAWIALALVALMLATFGALLAGSDRRDGSLVVVPASANPVATVEPTRHAADALVGVWMADLAASGIDDSYGGSPRPDGLTFASSVRFRVSGTFEVSTGAGGGCTVPGTWADAGNRIAISLTTAANTCEAGGIGPGAREIRLRLVRAARFTRAGDLLTLYDAGGDPLLFYRRMVDPADPYPAAP